MIFDNSNTSESEMVKLKSLEKVIVPSVNSKKDSLYHVLTHRPVRVNTRDS